MDAKEQQAWQAALERKHLAAQQAASKPSSPSSPGGEANQQSQAEGLYAASHTQDDFSARDKNSGHGKKTADKWNQ